MGHRVWLQGAGEDYRACEQLGGHSQDHAWHDTSDINITIHLIVLAFMCNIDM